MQSLSYSFVLAKEPTSAIVSVQLCRFSAKWAYLYVAAWWPRIGVIPASERDDHKNSSTHNTCIDRHASLGPRTDVPFSEHAVQRT